MSGKMRMSCPANWLSGKDRKEKQLMYVSKNISGIWNILPTYLIERLVVYKTRHVLEHQSTLPSA